MGDTSPSSSPPTSVLGALEQDWLLFLQDKDHPKRSVKDCLRRSKTLPCPQVLAVLQEQQQKHGLNRQELKLSYYSVLSSYLGRLKDASTNTKAEESSSLWHISKVATSIRFLQLLFEYRVGPEEDENADPFYAANSTTTTSSSSTTATVGAGDAEMNKMILQLIQSLSAVVCTCLEAAATVDTDEEDFSCPTNEVYTSDASQSFDARKVACFVFGSLVRINHYVRFRPSLLSPLWKGLCDMASAMKELPSELLNEAVKALLDYLREGTEPTLQLCTDVLADYRTKALSASASSSSRSSSSLMWVNANQQLFQVKILGFLMARTTSLLKLPLASETAGSVALAQVFQVLALLRGLGATVEATVWLDEQQQPNRGGVDELAAFLKPYMQIATKIERAVCGLVWNRDGGDDDDDAETLFDVITLNMLCNVKPLLSWSNSNVSSISDAAIALGKAMLLLKILEEALEKNNSSSRTFSQADVEAVVRICEDLLFRTLPSCYGSLVSNSPVALNILSRSIRLVSASLLCCEVACPCIATNADPGRHRFHRLLVKWLMVSPSPTQKVSEHPLTRELVTTVIYLHTVGLCESDNGGHLEAEPLLLLLVKLFFDARTNTGLRANIGSVVSRILGSSMRCVSKRLEDILVEDFALLAKTMAVEDNKLSKKRKRSTTTKRIDIMDLNIICSVMSIFPSGCLADCQDLLKLDPPANKLSIEAAIVRAAQSTGNAECKLGNFIECFSRLWNDESRRTNSRYMERLTLFGTMVVRLAHASSDASEREHSDGKVRTVCRLIMLCTEDRLLHSVTKQKFPLTPVVFEAIRLLGVVGKVLLPSSAQSLLQDLAAVFHRLLSCTSWSIRSFAMSSLVRFASTLPSIHKTILPKCVPTEMQELLQCRLQSSVCGQSETLGTTRAAHAKTLSRPVSSRCLEGSIFPTSGSLTIAQGSYCMTMPTQDGRKAIVIFPPGQDSLEDISFMLGMDEDDDKRPTVQTLHKTVVSEEGTCKLLLRS